MSQANIDASFVHAITELAHKSRAVEVKEVPGLPGELMVRESEGKLSWKQKPPPRIAFEFHGLEGFARYLTPSTKEPEVFVAPDRVVAMLDPAVRAETIKLPLVRARQWIALIASCSTAPKAFTVPEAISFLRFALGAEGQASVDAMLTALRAMEVSVSSRKRSETGTARESMGVEVERSVTPKGGGSMPKDILIRVPVFSTEGFDEILVEVALGLDVDFESGAEIGVSFVPIGDTIEQALEAALVKAEEAVAKRLPGLRVFRGVPTVV